MTTSNALGRTASDIVGLVSDTVKLETAEVIRARVSAENAAEPYPRPCGNLDCLCARALTEATGDQWIVGIWWAIRVSDEKIFRLPDETADEILRWANGGEVPPFEFEARELR